MFFQRQGSQPTGGTSLTCEIHGLLEGRCELTPQAIGVCGRLLTMFPLYIGPGGHLISVGMVGVLRVLRLD